MEALMITLIIRNQHAGLPHLVVGIKLIRLFLKCLLYAIETIEFS